MKSKKKAIGTKHEVVIDRIKLAIEYRSFEINDVYCTLLHQWFPLVQIALLGYGILYAKIGFSMAKVTLEFNTIQSKVFFISWDKRLHVHISNLFFKNLRHGHVRPIVFNNAICGSQV